MVVTGTPMDLVRILDAAHPVRRVTYELRKIGTPTLSTALAPNLDKWRRAG